MNLKKYQDLCAAMGFAKWVGKDVSADIDILEEAAEKLVGTFREDASARIHSMIYGAKPPIENRDAARDAMNALCVKYGVPLVCDPNESAEQTAVDLAGEAMALLLGTTHDRSTLTGMEWYLKEDPVDEKWHEILLRVCRGHGVSWPSATEEERAEIEREARETFEKWKEETSINDMGKVINMAKDELRKIDDVSAPQREACEEIHYARLKGFIQGYRYAVANLWLSGDLSAQQAALKLTVAGSIGAAAEKPADDELSADQRESDRLDRWIDEKETRIRAELAKAEECRNEHGRQNSNSQSSGSWRKKPVSRPN